MHQFCQAINRSIFGQSYLQLHQTITTKTIISQYLNLQKQNLPLPKSSSFQTNFHSLQQNFYNNLIVIETMEENKSNSPKKHYTQSLTQCSNPLNSPSLSFSKEPTQSSQGLPDCKILFPNSRSTSISSQNQPNITIALHIYGHRACLDCSEIQQVQNELWHLQKRMKVQVQVWISIKLVLLRHLSQQNSLFSELYIKTLEQYSNTRFDQINSAL